MNNRKIISSPPGISIKEQLEDRKMSQKEFARRMGMSEKHISRLLNGEVSLTPEMSLNLETVLGVPAYFWNNLEIIYREKLARIKAEIVTEKELLILEKIPVRSLILNKWIEDEETDDGKIMKLRKYFEVVNLELLENTYFPVNLNSEKFRKTQFDYEEDSLIQKIMIEARGIESSGINIRKIRKTIREFSENLYSHHSESDSNFVEKLNNCGIAVIFLRIEENTFSRRNVIINDGKRYILGIPTESETKQINWKEIINDLKEILSETPKLRKNDSINRGNINIRYEKAHSRIKSESNSKGISL